MKLSEILAKPFKVKGGGTVNLKGLSKHIVDKEVGGNNNDDGWQMIIDIAKLEFNATPHPTIFCKDDNLVNIEDIEAGSQYEYSFLYKKSELPNPMSSFTVFRYFIWNGINYGLRIVTESVNKIGLTFTIDGEEYVTLINDGPA